MCRREGPYLLPRTNADRRTATVKGTLKGYDALMNLVLDNVQETLRGEHPVRAFGFDGLPKTLDEPLVLTVSATSDDDGNESTRSLGLVVARGTLLVLISPVDGSEEIANPFVQPDED